MKNKRYYVIVSARKVTGGVELAHQMCRELLEKGCQAWMYYIQSEQKEPVDALPDIRYKKYGTSHVNSLEGIDSEDSVLIVPEGAAAWALPWNKCKRVLWWMSVDNYVRNAKLSGVDYFDDLRKRVSLHLVQSEYAFQYLLGRGIPRENILKVSDYIGENYGKFQLPCEFRKDIALYNPQKGLEELRPLIERIDWLKWIPLINLTEEQMMAIMGIAKVYIDFGGHPGKDRIPREAASSGCCVITNKKGSAHFYEDIPIPDCYKIDDVPKEYDRIENLLKDICIHWEKHYMEFEEYRRFISGERQRFAEDAKTFVNVMEGVKRIY